MGWGEGVISVFDIRRAVIVWISSHNLFFVFVFPFQVLILVGRAVNIFPLSFILNFFREHKITRKNQCVMWFSGLRGAVAFALSLHLELSAEKRYVLVTATLIIVLFTIMCLGGATMPVLKVSFFSLGEREEEGILAKYKMFFIYTFLDLLTVCICMWCIHACMCGVYMCDVSLLVCVLCVMCIDLCLRASGFLLFLTHLSCVVSDSLELCCFWLTWAVLFLTHLSCVVSDSLELYVFLFFCAADEQQLWQEKEEKVQKGSLHE